MNRNANETGNAWVTVQAPVNLRTDLAAEDMVSRLDTATTHNHKATRRKQVQVHLQDTRLTAPDNNLLAPTDQAPIPLVTVSHQLLATDQALILLVIVSRSQAMGNSRQATVDQALHRKRALTASDQSEWTKTSARTATRELRQPLSRFRSFNGRSVSSGNSLAFQTW